MLQSFQVNVDSLGEEIHIFNETHKQERTLVEKKQQYWPNFMEDICSYVQYWIGKSRYSKNNGVQYA
jgi:hypothetical protein